MANTDKPHGFDPFGSIKQVNPFRCDTTTTAIFRGDMVSAMATGYVKVAAAADTQLVGPSIGYQAVYSTAGTYDVLLLDDPDQVYYAQTVTGTSPARTMINSFCDHIAGTGSATTLLSGHELNIGTTDTTVSYGFRLIDFLSRDDNDKTVEHAEMICVMNEAARHTITAGV
jgi:hypothetical protein